MNVLDLFSGHRRLQPGVRKCWNANRRLLRNRSLLPACPRSSRGQMSLFNDDVANPYRCRALWLTPGRHRATNIPKRSPEALAPGAKTIGGCRNLREEVLTSSAAASPARTSQSPERARALTGERSGLWSEYARIIGEVRPDRRHRGERRSSAWTPLGRVLGDLAALGFDAEWHCIPASAVGAPHRRDRVSDCGLRQRRRMVSSAIQVPKGDDMESIPMAAPGRVPKVNTRLTDQVKMWPRPTCLRLEHQASKGERRGMRVHYRREVGWLVEPDVGRVAHGVPARVDRLRSLGNAVVSQIPEIIGRAIMRCA